jgi:hypothetical protein
MEISVHSLTGANRQNYSFLSLEKYSVYVSSMGHRIPGTKHSAPLNLNPYLLGLQSRSILSHFALNIVSDIWHHLISIPSESWGESAYRNGDVICNPRQAGICAIWQYCEATRAVSWGIWNSETWQCDGLCEIWGKKWIKGATEGDAERFTFRLFAIIWNGINVSWLCHALFVGRLLQDLRYTRGTAVGRAVKTRGIKCSCENQACFT